MSEHVSLVGVSLSKAIKTAEQVLPRISFIAGRALLHERDKKDPLFPSEDLCLDRALPQEGLSLSNQLNEGPATVSLTGILCAQNMFERMMSRLIYSIQYIPQCS
jgi:hypothetical protein